MPTTTPQRFNESPGLAPTQVPWPHPDNGSTGLGPAEVAIIPAVAAFVLGTRKARPHQGRWQDRWRTEGLRNSKRDYQKARRSQINDH
jgi:hypothetical protein